MFNEPPYAERHVRWCEGTGNQIMITFLLYLFETKYAFCEET